PNIVLRGWGQVCGALAAIGYDAEWACLPASAFGAPFEGLRFYAVASPTGQRGEALHVLDPGPAECARQEIPEMAGAGIPDRGDGEVIRRIPDPRVCRVADGLPRGLDRLRGLGNAVVPQVAEWIGRRIVESE